MNRIVLITGASRGIGAATARHFAEAGDTVVLNYHRSEDAARALASALDGFAVRADVSDPVQVRWMMDEVMSRYGRIDVLVNNAAVSVSGLFQTVPEAEAKRLWAVNVEGMCSCTRAVLPGMLSRQSGCIVNLASMWGEVGASCEVHYSMSKAAVIGFTKALAKELGPSHIRVNCVSPGVISTDMNAHLSAEDYEALREETPLGEIGTVDQVADAICFLASERAAFITGQVLGVSGGFCI